MSESIKIAFAGAGMMGEALIGGFWMPGYASRRKSWLRTSRKNAEKK